MLRMPLSTDIGLACSQNLCDTNLPNSLEQISSYKRCSAIRRSKVLGDFSAVLEAESPVLHRSVGFHLQQEKKNSLLFLEAGETSTGQFVVKEMI